MHADIAVKASLLRKPVVISIAVYSLVFWIWRLPFILWLPLPEFSPDTFGYFAVARALHNKVSLSYTVDIPLAFPFFIHTAAYVSSKVMFLIWLHFTLKFSAGLLLVYVFSRHYKWLGVAAAVILCMYFTDSWSLRYDTALIADSLYNSFLIAAVAFLIISFKSATSISLALLSVSLFLVAFTRSNGIYIYFIIPVMAVLLFRSRHRMAKLASLMAPAIILQAGVSIFKATSDIVQPANNRLMTVLSREAASLQSAQALGYLNKKWSLAKDFFRMDDFPSFYFSLLPARHHNTYVLDEIHNPDYKMFNWDTPIPDDLRRYVYREYYTEPQIFRRNMHMMDVSYAKRNPLFLMIHVLYKFQSVVFRNVLWYILFLCIFLFGCWRYARSRFADREALMVVVLCAIHLLGLLVVIFGHENAVSRYAHVSEFILYLSPVFALMLVLPEQAPPLKQL